jgi:hypothetical protein
LEEFTLYVIDNGAVGPGIELTGDKQGFTAACRAADQQMAKLAARNILNVLAGERPETPVNPDVLK